MPLRWILTSKRAPVMFNRGETAPDDQLLLCGGWTVGRVMPAAAVKQGLCSWSLTGPHTPEAPMLKQGDAPSLEAAKVALVDCMRAWSVWAGVRQAGGCGPLEPRWERSGHPSYEDAPAWVMVSGAFVGGRVWRPRTGPRHDPCWMLFGVSVTDDPPQPRGGWADSIDAAKADLLAGWRRWLAWAELSRSNAA